MQQELAYKRKARLRGKNRKVRYANICDTNNLWHAQAEARKGKNKHKGVRIFDRHQVENMQMLQDDLQSMTYQTSPGKDCTQLCPCGKVRTLHKLPFYPDHIVHHAMMRQIMPILDRYYYYDSSASIKGRGIHYAAKRVERYIDEHKYAGRLYYVKLDFVKFYHNIDQETCYNMLSRHFSDRGVRYLLYESITATDEGLGIGLYPIQPIANFYLCPMVRQVMSHHKVHIFIYCDDIVVIGEDKREVWRAVNEIQDYARDVLRQPIHDNIGMQVIDERHFLDFVGYRFYFDHTLLRKRMKQKFCRKMKELRDPVRRYQVATAYKGWLMHCDGLSLWRKTLGMRSYKDLELPDFCNKDKNGNEILDGQKTSGEMLCGHTIVFNDISMFESKMQPGKQSAWIQVTSNGKLYKFSTANQVLIEKLQYCKKNNMLPFEGELYNKAVSGTPNYDIR